MPVRVCSGACATPRWIWPGRRRRHAGPLSLPLAAPAPYRSSSSRLPFRGSHAPSLLRVSCALPCRSDRAGAGSLPGRPVPERPIRRTIPITRSFERGLAAGTRDSTGRPGARYWQLPTDYSIDARLDPATGIVSGTEIGDHHESERLPSSDDVAIRLDQNIFGAQHGPVEPECRPHQRRHGDAADGQRPGGERRQPAASAGARTTLVRVRLGTPIAAGGTGTLEVNWAFKVPVIPDGQARRPDGSRGAPGSSSWRSGIRRWRSTTTCAAGTASRTWATPEFYNNYGSFDVQIDVPAGWLVGATGVLANPDRCSPRRPGSGSPRRRPATASSVIVGADERGAGKAPLAGRPPGLALHRRQRDRLRLGHVERVRLGRDPGHDSGPRASFRSTSSTSPRTPCTSRPVRWPGTRSSSTPRSGCPTPGRSLHAGGRSRERHGVPDAHHERAGLRRDRPRDRAPVVADDGGRATRPGTAGWTRASTST